MKLIDKDKVIAEIEKLIDKGEHHEELDCAYYGGKNAALYALKGRIDTLELKEVDLDKILTKFMSRYAYENGGEYPSAIDIAKHFFELGLKARGDEI